MRLRCLLVGLLIALCAAAAADDLLSDLRASAEAEMTAAAQVAIKTKTIAGTGDAVHHDALETQVTLATGETTYQLQYDCATDELGRRLPMGQTLSELGMSLPSPANWYQGGFLDVLVDGLGLVGTAATIEDLKLPAGQAGVRLTWGKTVTLDLRVYAFDPVLYAVLELPVAKQREIALLCYPNSFGLPRDRWVTTSKRDVQHRDNLRETVPAEERDWVLYSDRSADLVQVPKNGPCALVLLPEQWSDVTLAMGEPERPDWPAVQNYGVVTRLKPAETQTRVALGLIDFLPMTWLSAKANLTQQTPAIQARLRGLLGQ